MSALASVPEMFQGRAARQSATNAVTGLTETKDKFAMAPNPNATNPPDEQDLVYAGQFGGGRFMWHPTAPKSALLIEWLQRRDAVFARDGNRCVYCGVKPRGNQRTVDHVVPASRGGSDEMDNLVTACRSCNSSKHDRTLDEWRAALATAPERRAEAKRIAAEKAKKKQRNRRAYKRAKARKALKA